MAEDNKSLFSNINTFFRRATDALDGVSNRLEAPVQKEFITAASQEDVAKTAVEDGAIKFYRQQSTKIDRGNDQRKLMYESSRLMLYYDYLSMDGYPILGAALDLLAEEATTTKSDTGQILNIYSSSDKVKKELERFFYKVMDVNTNLFYWCRNMCQYGDNFVFLELSKENGVVDFRQLASQFVERNEKYDTKNRYRAFFKYKDPNSGGEEEYMDYQVAHFRLLGTGDRLPYGCSVYEKVRRTYKQLFMMEDAMMVYRITRAAERRIYKVPVGNVPAEDVPQILEAFANNVKKKKLVDPKTGDINFKYNVASMDEDIFVADRGNSSGSFVDTLPGACLSLDTKIKLLDGRSLELSKIIEEHNNGKELWSYSINPSTGEIVESPITWAGVTREETQVIKLHLSNGKYLICTPDHKIFCKSKNELLQAKDFEINDVVWSYNEINELVISTMQLRLNNNTPIKMIYDYKNDLWRLKSLITKPLNAEEEVKERGIDRPEDIFITNIEYLTNLQDTGTITIDGKELYHNYHNFPLDCGIFVNNSNLEAISDINYLRDNLFTGLGIHKTLLGFSSDQASGEGKNLSMLDIRFARKVNRIQQALLGELNKIAIIHLGLLGGDYESYIDDFKLSLNNPSTASDLLQLEIWKSKFEVYGQATTPNQNSGLKPMSEMMAKKRFFHMSEEDIINDLQEQMLESKIGEEVKGAGMLLKTSGVMDKMIKYKNAGFKVEGQPQGEQQQIDNSLGGGLGGGADMGGGAPPMGGPPPTGGEGSLPPPTGGGGEAGGAGFLSEDIFKKTDELARLIKE